MRNFIIVLIAALLMPSVTLAVKPVKVDLQAMIEDETQARIEDDAVLQSNITAEEIARQDGDTALQGQIDGINTDITTYASVMYLRANSPSDPPYCPEPWAEAGLAWVPAGSGYYYYERTCFYCAQ